MWVRFPPPALGFQRLSTFGLTVWRRSGEESPERRWGARGFRIGRHQRSIVIIVTSRQIASDLARRDSTRC